MWILWKLTGGKSHATDYTNAKWPMVELGEVAEILNIEYKGQNQVSGISGKKLKMREGIIKVKFGKDREFYSLTIPILVPMPAALTNSNAACLAASSLLGL